MVRLLLHTKFLRALYIYKTCSKGYAVRYITPLVLSVKDVQQFKQECILNQLYVCNSDGRL